MPNLFSLFCCCSRKSGYTSIEDAPTSSGNPAIDYLRASSFLPSYAYRTRLIQASKGSLRQQSTRVLVQERATHFRDWQTYSPEIESHKKEADPTLASIESMDFYENAGYRIGERAGVSPTAIYLAPHVLETSPWSKAGILTLDFDMTITKAHTYTTEPNNKRLRGYNLDNAGREANLRHPQRLRETLASARAANICVTIATRHDDMPHVLAYLQTLVTGIDPSAKIEDYISVVLCSFSLMDADPTAQRTPDHGAKNGELSFTRELLLRNCEHPHLVPMTLVDDDARNQPTKFGALSSSGADISFIHAPEPRAHQEDSDAYLGQVQQFITHVDQASTPVGSSPVSSSHSYQITTL